MKYNTTVPIYLQIMDRIKKDIVTEVLPKGERISSVRVLAEQFEVNLNTMQRACSELEREGVIFTQRGVGSFVTNDEAVLNALKEKMSGSLVKTFVSEMKELGYSENEMYEILKKELKK
ncbi:GntR family transcriptional regulator [Anaerosacchariphilus polymeriproducens]|uniref:GntR family transcriptional regulator n=1 Tax=Anaerosacchariphilus polymeriproducens TaxID=1812858 RepID=A0A371AUW3_9FIRM|nr:GntR family transcriptional regulator [Anaerosacchariphilus polymeriproducens]RDU23358.1 GntR family transcriptional regulator [Anaerosacchariphilus polymeriproducens]